MVWLRYHRTLRFLGKADLCDRRWADDELCEPAEVLRDCRQCELELSASWPAQAQTIEPKDALEMCKQHLNTFAIAARSFECFGLRQRSGYVTRFLIDAALESAQRRLWTTLRLEEAAAAIACPGPVVQRLCIIKKLARRCENLACRTAAFRSLSNVKSSRLNVPSSRFDLSTTGICGAIFASLTSQLSVVSRVFRTFGLG